MAYRPGRRLRNHGRFPPEQKLQYEALHLHEIRLLHLRYDHSGRARHRIEKMSLHRPRYSYVALSYTWGSPADQDSRIRINGREKFIPRNLRIAIDGLYNQWLSRSGTREPLRIWIDQLCINQADGEEKREQIELMSLIYMRAHTVFVELSIRLPLAFRPPSRGPRSWERYAHWHHKHMYWRQASSGTNTRYPYTGDKTQKVIDAWQNVHSIVTSRWWSKAWVYQEFLLAGRAMFLIDGIAVQWQELNHFLQPFFDERELHIQNCQRALVTLDRSYRELLARRPRCCLPRGLVARGLLEKLDNSQTVIHRFMSRLQSSESQWQLAEETLRAKADRDGHIDLEPLTRLSTLMSHSRKRQSTYDRDKVYSVLGLMDPEVAQDIPVDYPADAQTLRESDVDLLVDVAKLIMNSEQRLDILAIPSSARWDPADQPMRTRNFAHRLPSWVPDWFLPLEDLYTSEIYNFELWNDGLPGYRSRNFHEDLGHTTGNLAPVFSFPNTRTTQLRSRVLRVRALYAFTLGQMVEDLEHQGWTRYVARSHNRGTNAEVDTSQEARPGDEVWVIFGCNKPLTLRNVDRTGQYRCVLGPAVVRERYTERLMSIHRGSWA